jgi:outer membrane receptor protein involved in Fe transport
MAGITVIMYAPAVATAAESVGDLTLNLRAGIQLASWTWTAYVRNLTDDDTPVAALDFVNFGTVDVNYPVNQYGNLLNDKDPRMFSLNPRRGRDWGLEAQYRF